MKKIFITGGEGFFATRFVKHYENQYEICAPGRTQLDITDSLAVQSQITAFCPHYILHTAAIANTDVCENNPEEAYAVNVAGAIHVAKAAKSIGAKMIFISTEQIFNGNANTEAPYTEATLPQPDTIYGKTKYEAEQQLQKILPELWILRFTWLFGLPERLCPITSNILWSTIQKLLQQEKNTVPIYEYRGMTYVYEMIEAIPTFFTAPYGTYHVGSWTDQNRYEIVKEIFRLLGLTHKIPTLLAEDTLRYKECVRELRIDTKKATQIGVSFSTVEQGLARCLSEFQFQL